MLIGSSLISQKTLSELDPLWQNFLDPHMVSYLTDSCLVYFTLYLSSINRQSDQASIFAKSKIGCWIDQIAYTQYTETSNKSDLLYTYKKYPSILPIFLLKNTKSCITLLAFSDSVSPSSIVYPRRTTFTLVLYLGKTRQRAGI